MTTEVERLRGALEDIEDLAGHSIGHEVEAMQKINERVVQALEGAKEPEGCECCGAPAGEPCKPSHERCSACFKYTVKGLMWKTLGAYEQVYGPPSPDGAEKDKP